MTYLLWLLSGYESTKEQFTSSPKVSGDGQSCFCTIVTVDDFYAGNFIWIAIILNMNMKLRYSLTFRLQWFDALSFSFCLLIPHRDFAHVRCLEQATKAHVNLTQHATCTSCHLF
jgi:hypothetical protein